MKKLEFVDTYNHHPDLEGRRKWIRTASPKEIEEWLDGGGRHDSSVDSGLVLLDRILDLGRTLGVVVTRDGTWGEAEKTLAIIGRAYVQMRREEESLL